ncbi:MAG: protease modulator HflC [Archangium sp.]|nr:protease modulator HflC [Archangium sp.]MDP3154280.1 protease modulator HflC [Archangium sp.]MDP3575968.1 protease modulator HflC [Archangium sp.]
MKTRLALILAAVVAFIVWSSAYVVDEKELVIVTQFGEFKRAVMEPGLEWKLPFVQQVHVMERRVLSSDASQAEYLTLDKKRIVADPVTRWRIADPLKFFTTVHDQSGARARLDDIVLSEMRREISSHDFGDIIGNERDPLMQAVAVRTGAKALSEFGIEIIDVRIKRADLPREVQESVFARMRAERERIAKQYRSEGEEEAAKIRAETDKEKTILLARAYERSQTLRGQGDALSTRIYAEAHAQDPEFFTFTRSLEAYERVLTGDSTLVLSSGSELFRYLGQPGKK